MSSREGRLLHFAYSTDGFNWTVHEPGSEETIVDYRAHEMSAFYDPHSDSAPFKIIGNAYIGDHPVLCLWSSKDGIDWEDRRELMDDKPHYDTQNTIIPTQDGYTLYARQLKDGENRKISVCHFDKVWNKLDTLKMLNCDYMYNSGASRLSDEEDIIFPTYMNNLDGGNGSTFEKCYVVNGYNIREIPCDFNRWIKDDEKWVTVAPGILNIAGEQYVAYYTWTRSHDTADGAVKSRYYLIKIQFEL